MSIRIGGACAFILAAVMSSASAGDKDFWAAKNYLEWTEKEVDKLLKSSPWSQTFHVTPEAGAGRPSITTRTGGRSDGGADISRGGAGGAGTPGDAIPVSISWMASPVRQAVARRLMLENPEISRQEVEKVARQINEDSIEIMILGWSPGGGGRGTNPMQRLRQETFLIKKNKEKIPLSEVLPPAGRGQPLILRFPREVDGRPVVAAEDKEIDLVTNLTGNTLRAKFKFSAMVVKGELEY